MAVDVVPVSSVDEATRLAVYAFLARSRAATLRAYGQDLQAYLRWCEAVVLAPLLAERAHLELYVRWMEERGYAATTIGRRLSTIAGFYRYALVDGRLSADRRWR